MPLFHSELINQALQRACDTRDIRIGEDIVSQCGSLFLTAFTQELAHNLSEPHIVLVADETTWNLAGKAVEESFTKAGVTVDERLIFPAQPPVYADYHTVGEVEKLLKGHPHAFACSIGSGTLSDVTKLASGECARPYMHVCTAASMDGYAAYGAAVSKDGFKITRSCPAPRALVADLAIMRTAPAFMNANGYGDMIEKFPGGADWIVADAVGVEKIDRDVWNLVQPPLRAKLAHPAGVRRGDVDALRGLVELSMLSGLAIQAHHSSRPGSGAGHNFSHQWEMEGYGLDWPLPLSHGAKVAIGSVAMAALYDAVLSSDLTARKGSIEEWLSPEENAQRVRLLHPIPAIREAAVEQSMAKYVPREDIAQRQQTILHVWPDLKEKLRAQMPTALDMKEMLTKAGSFYHPAQIGISLTKLHTTYYQAQTIRSRYTVMDMLYDLGRFNEVVDSLFQPGGFWYELTVPERVIFP